MGYYDSFAPTPLYIDRKIIGSRLQQGEYNREVCEVFAKYVRLALAVLAVVLPGLARAQANLGTVDLGGTAVTTVTVPIASAGILSSIAVVTQGAPNLDFTNVSGGTCSPGIHYAANDSCTINVTFAPQVAGARYGAIVLADQTGVIGTEYLQGTGVGPQAVPVYGPQVTVAIWYLPANRSWPSGVAIDGSGNVYIIDNDQMLLFKETLSGNSYIQSVIPTSALGNPYGVAVDGAGNVYVTDANHFRVLKETPFAGGYIESTVATFPMEDGSAPIGVAIDGKGNVYISLGSDIGAIYEEAPTSSGYLQTTVANELSAAAGVAVDGNGDIYLVLNQGNGWIMEETPSAGGYRQSTIPISTGGIPFGVAVDGDSNVYATFIESNDSGVVFRETAEAGGYTQSTIPTIGLNQPMGVAVDALGNVYVADSYNERVLKIPNTAGRPSADFSVGVAPPSITLSAGESSTETVSVTPFLGFNSAVSFLCAGVPAGASCGFSPQSVTPSGNVVSTKLTVTMSPTTAALSLRPLFLGWTMALALCGFTKQRLGRPLLLAVSVASLAVMGGCAETPKPSPTTSTVTVIATAGSLQHAAAFSLTVQ
jgi:DNA-binding beta-propeller fold protein YncE